MCCVARKAHDLLEDSVEAFHLICDRNAGTRSFPRPQSVTQSTALSMRDAVQPGLLQSSVSHVSIHGKLVSS